MTRRNTSSNRGIIVVVLTVMLLSAAAIPAGAQPALDIQITPPSPVQNQTVTVTVLSGGTPVQGADVYFVLNGGIPVHGQTDANGKVNYIPLLPGKLNITALYMGMSTSVQRPVSAPPTPTPTPTPTPIATPTTPSAAVGGGGGGAPHDTDGDGFSDVNEMLAGTDREDPCDPNPESVACLAIRPPTPTPTPTPTATPTPTPTPAPAPLIPLYVISLVIVIAVVIIVCAYWMLRVIQR